MLSVIESDWCGKVKPTYVYRLFRNQLCATIIDVKLSFDLIIAME